jgi:glutathione S-transferase
MPPNVYLHDCVGHNLSMTITLYDLAGADSDLRFSPYCWRSHMALAHKDLSVKTLPWRFSEKSRLTGMGTDKVPVLTDGKRVVADSWGIAEYLEEQYPERPSLFEGPGGHAHAKFINAWADSVMIPGIARLVVHDIWSILAPRDQEYFRDSREARFGARLEDVQADREEQVQGFRKSLAPVRQVLKSQPWLGGSSPTYADYIVFGGLQWARCASRFELLAQEDPISTWRSSVLDLFGGLAGRAKTC